MSKIPTACKSSKLGQPKIISKNLKKVVVTRRSSMFNKKTQKENTKLDKAKAGTQSGASSNHGISTKQPIIKPALLPKDINKRVPQASTSTQSTTVVSSRKRVLNIAENGAASQGSMAKIKKTTTAATRTVTATTTKTANAASTKTTAKIPPYDFKARFNNLREIHTNFKTNFDTLKQEFNEANRKIEELETSKAQLTVKNASLEKDLVEYKKQQLEFEQFKIEFLQVQEQLANVITERDSLIEELQMVKSKRDKLKEKCKEFLYTKQELEKTQTQLASATEKLMSNEILRMKLHNDVQDLKGNIRVFCRCRPVISQDSNKVQVTFSYMDEQTLQLYKQENSKYEFAFDKVYTPNSRQEFVFEDLAQLVQSSLDGYNVCVFAYGQTGSGKTYTMIGENEPEKKGMIPRTLELLFKKIKDCQDYYDYKVQLSILEIYNEHVRDLLNVKKNISCEIRINDGKGMSVTNLDNYEISSPEEFYLYLQKANKNRAVAVTDLNEHSSRSHAVIQLQVTGSNKRTGVQYKSIIYLVDLAGSESAKTSKRMEETKAINKSLSNLGAVILALQNKEKYVPYRNSKLTFLLQSALGGNSKTLMFVNVSLLEEHFNETLNSLRFASNVRKVITKSKRYAIAND